MSVGDSYSMILWYSRRLAVLLYFADRSWLSVISCQFEIILFYYSYVRLSDRLTLVTFGFIPFRTQSVSCVLTSLWPFLLSIPNMM